MLSWGVAVLAAVPLGALNKERVGRAGGCDFTGAALVAGATLAAAFVAAGLSPPKNENAGLEAGAGAG